MRKCKLSECVKEINDRTIENNQYEVLTSSKSGIFSQEEYFDKQVASKDNTGYKIIKNGQFTYRSMSDSGTFTINRLEDKEIGIVSPAYPVFEAINIDAEFLKYYFKSELFNKAIINLSQGSTRTALKFKDLIDIEIYLPEIEEQKRIVKILKNNDQIIEKYDELIKEKEQFIKSQFVEMFEKDESIKKTTVNNVADIFLGLTYTPKYTEDGIPFLSSKNISSQQLDLEDIKYISQDEYEKVTNNAKPIYGDILFSRVGSNLGNPTIFDTNLKCAIFVSLGYLRIKNKNEFDNIFVRDWMKSENFWHQVFNKVSGGAKQNLNTNWLRNFEIPNPSIEKQNKYKNIVQLIDKQKFNYINKIKLLNEIINIFLGGKKI